MSDPIRFILNGEPVEANCRADKTVLEWLRGDAQLRGTKEGCAEGDCGACSVLLCRDGEGRNPQYEPANSCILLMGQIDGAALTTIEGLAAMGEGGHAVQQEMALNGSSQCGFCTPGIAVSLAGLLARKSEPMDADIHDALAGNLCRCTGYRPIVEAAQAAAATRSAMPTPKLPGPQNHSGNQGSGMFAPRSLKELGRLLAKHKDAMLLAGGTDLNIDVAHARARWPNVISTRHVAELRKIKKSRDQIEFGGAVTWQEALPHLEKDWPSFATLVRRFGSVQIRSMGTMAGNLATASPIGDGAPALLALGAQLVLASRKGEREIPLDKFFVDYRKSALKRDEIIRAIRVPHPAKGQEFRVYKISKRYDQDISTVCGAFSITRSRGVVTGCRIAYGGMAATPLRCTEAEIALIGTRLEEADIQAASAAVQEFYKPLTDMRGSADYRLLVAGNLVERFPRDLAGERVEVMA